MLSKTTIGNLVVLSLLFLLSPVFAHNQSPRAEVSQMIGMAKVTVDYGRPGVKGRVIWGELVPYGKLWKTGADRMTNITLSAPLKVNGTQLQAGTYGVLSIPEASQWTIILTKRADIHMPSTYKPEDDALRVVLAPEAAEFQERLQFTFDNLEMSSADLVLHWEKQRVRLHLAE
jgi:hypothetical protein